MPGLGSAREIRVLAIDLYGSGYEKAIELLDPVDRVIETTQIMLPGKVNLAAVVCNLIEASPPEELKKILLTMLVSISGLPVIPIVEIV